MGLVVVCVVIVVVVVVVVIVVSFVFVVFVVSIFDRFQRHEPLVLYANRWKEGDYFLTRRKKQIIFQINSSLFRVNVLVPTPHSPVSAFR